MDAETLVIESEEFHVASWSPGEDGEGVPPTQVHMVFHVKGANAIFVLRLKSRVVTDAIIAALADHRDDVWPA
jgi:hypothetical protein